LIISNLAKVCYYCTAFAGTFNNKHFLHQIFNPYTMRKSDLINKIAEKTGIPKVDVLVTLETMFKEVKSSLIAGEHIYIRGFGSFITKKRAAKIGRNIKRNIAVEIPEHFIPAFKPSKEFVNEVKTGKLSTEE
jgi:DNA-binding protein HU-beta